MIHISLAQLFFIVYEMTVRMKLEISLSKEDNANPQFYNITQYVRTFWELNYKSNTIYQPTHLTV